MVIELNNVREEFPTFDKMTVKQLLDEKKFSFKLLVVKINGKLVPKDKYEETYIHDGYKVMVLHLISGG